MISNRVAWFLFALPLAAPSALLGADASVVIHQTLIGPMSTDNRDISITPDGARVALASTVGSRRQVSVDGHEGQPYSAILSLTPMADTPSLPLLMFSADGTIAAYAASKSPGETVMVVNQKEGPAFDRITQAAMSATGHRLVYIAVKGKDNFLVDDGKQSPAYTNVMPAGTRISHDAKHLAYVVQPGPGKMQIIYDGQPGATYTNITNVVLSPTGGHVAFTGSPTGTGNDFVMDIDGKGGARYNDMRPLQFSDDGGHWAYAANKTGPQNMPQWHVIADGQEGPAFLQIQQLWVSHTGKHIVYIAMANPNNRMVTYVVTDGKQSPDYAGANKVSFSPDDAHVAYIAQTTNGKSLVVFDGQESAAHDSVDPQSLTFSPDSQHFAYVAVDQNQQSLVVDGKAGATFRAIDPRSIGFTPQSQHYHFKMGGITSDWTVIMDNQVPPPNTPPDTLPSEIVYTPDGKHAVTVTGFGNGSAPQKVALDGKPVGQGFFNVQQLQISPDGQHVAFVAAGPNEEGNKRIHGVIDGHEGRAFFRIDRLILGPDGQHIAYLASDDGSQDLCVIDAVEGPAYQKVVLGSKGEGLQFRPDGSLSFYAAKDGRLYHMLMPASSLAAIKPPAQAPSAAVTPGYAQIHDFGGGDNDGAKPSVVAAGSDGFVYGATDNGGEFRRGTLFKVKPDGSEFKVLYSLEGNQNDGTFPNSILLAPDGKLYGSFHFGGKNGQGAIYQVDADGKNFKIIHPMTGQANDGGSPVLLGVTKDGTLLGFAIAGNNSSIFTLKTDGTYKNVYSASGRGAGKMMTSASDGGDGFIYGVASDILFKVAYDGSGYTVLHTFSGAPRETNGPDAAPLACGTDMLYGTSVSGGKSNTGIIYKVKRDGKDFTVVYNPPAGGDNFRPMAVTQGPDGKLYALVSGGIATLNPDGSEYKIEKKTESFTHSLAVTPSAFYAVTPSGGKSGLLIRYGFGAAGGSATPGQSIVFEDTPAPPLNR